MVCLQEDDGPAVKDAMQTVRKVSTGPNRLRFCLSTARDVKCMLARCWVSQVAGMDEIDTDIGIGSSESEDDVPAAKKAKHNSE